MELKKIIIQLMKYLMLRLIEQHVLYYCKHWINQHMVYNNIPLHSVLLVAPSVAVVCPSGHVIQEVDFDDGWYEPCGHLSQGTKLVFENAPAGHISENIIKIE